MKEYLITDFGVQENCDKIQTLEFQKVLDMCRENGGKVVVPPGKFLVSSLRMWSDTTLYLMGGAQLIGSTDCNDYDVFDIPEGVTLYTDHQAFDHDRKYYRRAIISAYGEKNISIIGEFNSLIDGMDCYDPDGEEHFRGPHGIFLSNCCDVLLKGYTIQRTGNFMHQTDNCENVTMTNVTALAGHDGIHLHKGRNFSITNCKFITGDDCIAGIGVNNAIIQNCRFNTSCNVFRLGGSNILIENCTADGPGYYPHRLSLYKSDNLSADIREGRHNTIVFFEFFASPRFKNCGTAKNIIIRNCNIDHVDRLINYRKDDKQSLHLGMNLEEISFENVNVTNLLRQSDIYSDETCPVTLRMKNVKMSFRDGENHPNFNLKDVNLINE